MKKYKVVINRTEKDVENENNEVFAIYTDSDAAHFTADALRDQDMEAAWVESFLDNGYKNLYTTPVNF